MSALELKLLGNRALNEGRPQEAISKYNAALKVTTHMSPHDCAIVLSNRAMAQQKLGRLDAACEDAAMAIEKDPSNIKAWYRRLKYLAENFELDAAQVVASEALARFRDDALVFDKLAAEIASRRAKALGEPSIKHFDLVEELGSGNYSLVWQARRKIDGAMFAIKTIAKADAEKVAKRHKNVHNEILMEKRALFKVRGHPNVVWLHATFVDYHHLYYCMEMCEGGELWAKLVRQNYRGEEKRVPTFDSLARFWLRELCTGLKHVHEKGLVHRDIKPENLMLAANGRVKLIDFGTVKDLVECDLNGPEFVGTPEYMAPEMVDSKQAGLEADWWAVGVVAYQFYVGHTPFKARSPYYTYLKIRKRRTKPLRLPPCFDADAADFVRSCLTYDPQRRLREPLRHPLLRTDRPTHLVVKVPRLNELALAALAERTTLPLHGLAPLEQARARRLLESLGCGGRLETIKRFYSSVRDAKHLRASLSSRTYLGFSNDEHFHFSQPFAFVIIASPKLHATEDEQVAQLRRAVSIVNRMRPPFVVVLGDFVADDEQDYAAALTLFRNTMTRISESIPIVYCRGGSEASQPLAESYERLFGSSFCSFWCKGARFVVLDPALFDQHTLTKVDTLSSELSAEQNDLIDDELEINVLGSHRCFIFAPQLPFTSKGVQDHTQALWAYRLLKGHVDAWFGGSALDSTTKIEPSDLIDFDPPREDDDDDASRQSNKTKPVPKLESHDDDDDDEEEEEDDTLKDCKRLSLVATPPVAGGQGTLPGFTIVTVFESAFSQQFYDFDSVPLP